MGPQFCCRCPPPRPALVPSQPLSAPPQARPFLSFKTTALLKGHSTQLPLPMAGTPRAEHGLRGLSWACPRLHLTPSAPGPHTIVSAHPTLGLESSIYLLSWLYHKLLLRGRDHLLPICVTHARWSRRPAHRAGVLTEGPGLGTTRVAPETTSNMGGMKRLYLRVFKK